MACCSTSLAAWGGVEATTPGSIVGGSGAGRCREGIGNSLCTIWDYQHGTCPRRAQARSFTHIVEPLKHVLEHARPFRAVACQLYDPLCAFEHTHMSMEPSTAACSSICALDSMLAVL